MVGAVFPFPFWESSGRRGAVKLLLVDGFYYAYRSFHSMPSLRNAEGLPTGAIYGFVKAVRRMMKDLQPDRAVIVWDEGLPERRTLLQPQYKAQREEMPEELQLQIEPMREFLALLGFSNVSLPGTEADDLMASYAKAAESLGWETILATADKDLFQIVGPRIRVYSTNKEKVSQAEASATGAGGTASFALLEEGYVRGKWGVAPAQLGDVLSLIGDSSDNIPGVSGVGPKGAAALVGEFGSLEAMYARLGEVKSEKLRERLVGARAQVEQNREMVRLDLDLALPVAPGELRVNPQYPEVVEAARRFGFKSLRAELELESSVRPDPSASAAKKPEPSASAGSQWSQGDLFS